jgi:hypothetical protein
VGVNVGLLLKRSKKPTPYIVNSHGLLIYIIEIVIFKCIGGRQGVVNVPTKVL